MITYGNGQSRLSSLDLKLTESAIEQVKRLLARDDRIGQGLRVGVTDGGCSGHSYKLDFDKAPKTGDTVLDHGKILDKHPCLIFADDIYEKIVYDGFEVHNIVALCPNLRERTIIINGVSKTYAMTGWRIGYAMGASDVMAAASKIQSQSTSNANSIAQWAALEAVRGPQEAVAMMVREFHKRRNVIVERLNAIPGIHCLKPEGAFYVFPNIAALIGKSANGKTLSSPCDVADYLLDEAKVAGVPGEDFGSQQHIRFSYATSLADIEKGCRRIGDAVAKLA